MNWTPRNIFSARDKIIISTEQRPYKIKLYSDGWAVIPSTPAIQSYDVWSICSFLNSINAVVSIQCNNCEYFPKCVDDSQKTDYCPKNQF